MARKSAAKKPKSKTAEGEAIEFSASEAEALRHLASFALEADVVRPPFDPPYQEALYKLGLLEKDDKPVVLEAVSYKSAPRQSR